jgi:hypothetical protein
MPGAGGSKYYLRPRIIHQGQAHFILPDRRNAAAAHGLNKSRLKPFDNAQTKYKVDEIQRGQTFCLTPLLSPHVDRRRGLRAIPCASAPRARKSFPPPQIKSGVIAGPPKQRDSPGGTVEDMVKYPVELLRRRSTLSRFKETQDRKID